METEIWNSSRQLNIQKPVHVIVQTRPRHRMILALRAPVDRGILDNQVTLAGDLGNQRHIHRCIREMSKQKRGGETGIRNGKFDR
jgi:hypothetical protein